MKLKTLKTIIINILDGLKEGKIVIKVCVIEVIHNIFFPFTSLVISEEKGKRFLQLSIVQKSIVLCNKTLRIDS